MKDEYNRREFIGLGLAVAGLSFTSSGKKNEFDTDKIPLQQETYRFKIGQFDWILRDRQGIIHLEEVRCRIAIGRIVFTLLRAFRRR